MSSNQYPSDVQFAGLIQAATAAADAQERNASVLGKRQRDEDDSVIDTQLRTQLAEVPSIAGQLPTSTPTLQSSAAVLFREPSEKSKKYSRPPLGKVYIDLELPPESFLRLQNAAKEFMLDENHLERRDVVGHKKHSSNNDVAKLRLWSCVDSFLNQDNNGEKWFGHSAGVDVPDAQPRTFFWPEDRQKITKLCMPLFRKMVTNERQRIYASETRKQDSTKGDKTKGVDTAASQLANNTSLALRNSNGDSVTSQILETANAAQQIFSSNNEPPQNASLIEQLTLRVSLMTSDGNTNHRVANFNISAQSVTTLTALIEEARKHYHLGDIPIVSYEDDWFLPVVRIWLPDGLVRIKDDGQWMVALLSVGMVDWMDSEVKVLVEVGPIAEVINL